jgi:hypothetical protein
VGGGRRINGGLSFHERTLIIRWMPVDQNASGRRRGYYYVDDMRRLSDEFMNYEGLKSHKAHEPLTVSATPRTETLAASRPANTLEGTKRGSKIHRCITNTSPGYLLIRSINSFSLISNAVQTSSKQCVPSRYFFNLSLLIPLPSLSSSLPTT